MARLAVAAHGALRAMARPGLITLRPAAAPATRHGRLLRWAEFAVLFVVLPLVIALFLPPRLMFPALFLFTLGGLGLLLLTGSFDWHFLRRGWRQLPWAEAGLIALAVLASGLAILWLGGRGTPFALPRQAPQLMLLIVFLYPLLSALPQELIFRALFFHRYGTLMPSRRVAVAVNAAVFAHAHLMYWSPVVLVFTAVGGWLFARAYMTRGFPAAWFLHAVAGNVIFLVGMGAYFYTGAVQRPF